MSKKEQSIRTVTKVNVDASSKLEFDGVLLEDICIEGQKCKNEKCKLYHPSWENIVCIQCLFGKCKFKNCKKSKKWEDLIYEIDTSETYDVFTEQKFVKPIRKVVNENKTQQTNSSSDKSKQIPQQQQKVVQESPIFNIEEELKKLDSTQNQKGGKKKNQQKQTQTLQTQEKSIKKGQTVSQQLENDFIELEEYFKTKTYYNGTYLDKVDKDKYFYYSKYYDYVEVNNLKNVKKWLDMVKGLLYPAIQGSCKECGSKTETSLFDNRLCCIKIDDPFCSYCRSDIENVIIQAYNLGNKKYFFGKSEMKREIGIYNKLRPALKFLSILDVPKNFVEWVELIGKDAEATKVQCEVCKKNTVSRSDNYVQVGTLSGYVCSYQCKDVLKKRLKNQNQGLSLTAWAKQTNDPSQNFGLEENEQKGQHLDKISKRQDLSVLQAQLMQELSDEDYSLYGDNLLLLLQEGNQSISIPEILVILKKHNNDPYFANIELYDSSQGFDFISLKFQLKN